MERLRTALGFARFGEGLPCHAYREFTDREPNRVWSGKMWSWGVETGAEWFVTLQDDSLIAPCFWSALRAMMEAVPDTCRVLGLSSVHPMGREIERRGHRWYRTAAWCIGWGYAIRRDDLAEFLAWRVTHPSEVAHFNEDSLLNHWIRTTGRTAWHPVPTIVDHDTSIDSQYANDQHAHRRSSVTWRDYGEGSLTDPSWWRSYGGAARDVANEGGIEMLEGATLGLAVHSREKGEPAVLPVPRPMHCWFCEVRPTRLQVANGASICTVCVAKAVDAICSMIDTDTGERARTIPVPPLAEDARAGEPAGGAHGVHGVPGGES